VSVFRSCFNSRELYIYMDVIANTSAIEWLRKPGHISSYLCVKGDFSHLLIVMLQTMSELMYLIIDNWVIAWHNGVRCDPRQIVCM